MLGSSLSCFLRNKAFNVITQSRTKGYDFLCNPNSYEEVNSLLLHAKPDAIINLIAETSVENCEKFPERAESGNELPPKILASVLEDNDLKTNVIHISSDHLYSKKGLSKEEEVLPLNKYASSKLAGESFISSIDGTILRTNFFGKSMSPKRSSLTDWLFEKGIKEETITVYENVLFSALDIDYLCSLISEVIENPIPGIYNIGSKGGLTKADFAFMFLDQLGISTEYLIRGDYESSNNIVQRPLDMRMDSSKFSNTFKIELKSPLELIKMTAKGYKNET